MTPKQTVGRFVDWSPPGLQPIQKNKMGGQVKQEVTEVKMSMIRKRSQDHNQKKTYQRKDSVTVLVCEKMTERVEVDRQQEDDRRMREETGNVVTYND